MRKLILILLIVLVAGGLYGVYLYNKKPADTHDEKADFEISAVALTRAFTLDEEASNKKYVDKILQVSGTISEVDFNSYSIILDAADPLASVTCSFYKEEAAALAQLKRGNTVSVKGKCTGKLTDVVLNNCILSDSK
jgi:hypothetical protein